MVKKLTFILILAVFSAAAQSTGHNPKLSAELVAKDPLAQCNVIVQWKHIASEASHQKVLSRGGTIRRRYAKMAFGAYTVRASALNDLANDPEVSFVAPDRPVHAKLDYTAAAVNAPTAWNANLTGAGIGIALIDSGVNPSVDFDTRHRIVYSEDFTSGATTQTLAFTLLNMLGPTVAPDLYGHGEHVAGILAGNGASSSCGLCDRSLKGIAPGANLINLRVLDENGAGLDSEVIAAIDTAIRLAPLYNIRVINLSLGRPVYESYTNDPLCQAVEEAWKAGIVVVVAAGNDGRDNFSGNNGYGTIEAPGNDPYVITVGAMKTEGTYTRTDDLIASYSSKGPTLVDGIVKPDLVAPGNLVVSLLASTSATLAVQNPSNIVPLSYYENTTDSNPGNTFFLLSGTSMATPVVSAAAALLLHDNPKMTPDQVKARLMLTAYKTFPTSSVATDPTTGMTYVSYYDIFTVGAGYLDIGAALANRSLAQGTTLSPTAVYNTSKGTVGFVPDPTAVWNLTGVWGPQNDYDVRAVWGVKAIDATSTVWAVNKVWGVDATVSGTNSVSANRCVWGVGVNLSRPAAQSMSGGAPEQPAASNATQSTALSISVSGEN